MTSSVVLAADVGPCAAEGIRTGSDNIVIDLNGHRVFGAPGPGAGNIGVFVLNNGVTVKNGAVSGFDTGVFINGSNTNVTGLDVRDNVASSTSASGRGIYVNLTNNNRIIGNRVVNNGPQAGIRIFNGAGNVVDRNTIVDNAIAREGLGSHGEVLGQIDVGILIDAATGRGSAPANTITNNVIARNGSDGIRLMSNASNTTIRSNIISYNGVGGPGPEPGFLSGSYFGGGVYAVSSGNTIEQNRLVSNRSNGVFLEGATNSRIASNVSLQNGAGMPGAFDLKDIRPACDTNTWVQNTFSTRNQACIS